MKKNINKKSLALLVMAIVVVAVAFTACGVVGEVEDTSSGTTVTATPSFTPTDSVDNGNENVENNDTEIEDEQEENQVIPLEKIAFKYSELTIGAGQMVPMEVVFYPETATNQDYTMMSDNENAVTIVLGSVMAVDVGEANVTVTSVYNPELTHTCKIIVTDTTNNPDAIESEESKDIEEENKTNPVTVPPVKTTPSPTVNVTTGTTGTVNTTFGPQNTQPTVTETSGPVTSTNAPVKTDAPVATTTKPTATKTPVKTATPKPTQKPTATTTAAHKHSYTSKVTKATCTAGGYTTYTCVCGDSYTGNKTSALGHSYGAWKTVKEATTSAEGKQERTCSACGKKESKTIAKLTSKYDVPAVKGTEELVEERIIYYINKYRVEEGTKAATVLSDIYFDYAGIRSEQIIDNFAHDMDDKKEAATKLKFGQYYPAREETRLDLETMEVVYTGNIIPAHYEPYGAEAIGGGYGMTVDSLAKDIVNRCRASYDHWSYVGATSTDNKKYNYIAVGITFSYDYEAWVCIYMDETDLYK